jgi:hypothetical protein
MSTTAQLPVADREKFDDINFGKNPELGEEIPGTIEETGGEPAEGICMDGFVDEETGEIGRATSAIVEVEIAPSLLSAFANLASTDEERPILTGVQLTFQPQSVQVSATDSYVAGTYREATADPQLIRHLDCMEQLSIIVPVHTLAPLLKLKLRDENKEALPVLLTATKDESIFRRGPWSVVLPNIQGEFPNIMELMGGADPEPAELIGLAKPLGDFIKFAETLGCSTAMHLTLYGSNKAIGIRFVDSVLSGSFMGVVMPVRTEEDMQLNFFGLPEWLEMQMAESRASKCVPAAQ